MHIIQYTCFGDNLKNRAASIIVGTFVSSLLIMLLAMAVAPAFADTPSQPEKADAIWVDPPTKTLNNPSVTPNQMFNLTVWLNMTEDIFAYQVGILYNRTLLMCTRAGYTGGATSAYFAGHTTNSPAPVIDTGSLRNGSILAFETLLGADNASGPRIGSLFWAEFEVMNFTIPTGQNVTTKFDINSTYTSGDTWVWDVSLANIDIPTLGNGTLIVTPEFAYMLIMPIFMASTAAALILSKRRLQKKLK
jgi:hypothetical protein